MKHYVKNLYSAVPEDSFAMPSFYAQREQVTCFHCHRDTVIAVPPTGVDWESVAKDYKRYAEELKKRVMQMEQDIDLMFGKTPFRDYMANEMKALFIQLENDLRSGKWDQPEE